ncbi:LamG domain-containing protein, partial [Patescibacteria group bacterium]|nr:LamG domain-containing protein [Patescibacteria group bacterium]
SSGIQIVSFWLKPDNLTNYVIDLNGTQTITLASAAISANNFTSPTIYVDGKVSSTVPDTNWHHIAITTGTGVNASAVNIGKVGANYFDGKLDEIRFYNYARTADEIRLDYQAGYATHLGPSGKTCSEDPASCMDYGLVGNWGMDEGAGQTAYDASGNSNNGTLGSSASADTNDPKWISGRGQTSTGGGLTSTGGALQFDGINDYVNAGNDASLNITGAITVEAWVKLNRLKVNDRIINKYAFTDATNNSGYYLKVSESGYLAMGLFNNNTHVVYSPSPITTGSWYHIVGTFNGTQENLYINGVNVKTAA